MLIRLTAATCLLATTSVLAQPASFEGLGQLAGYTQGSTAVDASADGGTIVGLARGSFFHPMQGAYVATETWTWRAGSLTPHGRGPDVQSNRPAAISRDGSCIVGTELAFAAGYSTGWVERSGVTTSVSTPVGQFEPIEVNSDGSRMIGREWALDGDDWVQPGLRFNWQQLCPAFMYRMLDGSDNGTYAFECPNGLLLADGSFVVPPAIGPIRKINAAGTVVLGYQVWNIGQAPIFMGNFFEDPKELSESGEWVVGAGTINGTGPGPFFIGARIWSVRTGLRTLECVLREHGVLPPGWRLTDCVAISDDGTVLIGNGVNPAGVPEAWRAVIPFVAPSPDHNRDGVLSVQDIFEFLALYFSASPSADSNGSGTLTVQDIFDFLGAYFAGCL